MRHTLFAALLGGAILVGGAGVSPGVRAGPAEGPREKLEEAERLAEEAARRLMWLLKMMISNIPQYEMPEITDEGDIIIRRKRAPPPAPPRPDEDDETDT